eukprot:175193_1
MPDAVKYQQCVDDTKRSGFDFVDAFFGDNIMSAASEISGVSHNPEWMVQQAEQFIDNAVDIEQKPFFLYFAFTLSHNDAASIATTLTNLSAAVTPKGVIDPRPKPSSIGMKTRRKILEEADAWGPRTRNSWNTAAGAIWIDDAVGALLNYLKSKGEYNNTFIVLMNDHGQGTKGTLFEQGTRIIQFVRYPKLFNKNNRVGPHIVSEDFIVNEVDLAAVMFDIVDTHQDFPVIDHRISPYVLDGESWVDDVINEIEQNTVVKKCCKETFVDIEQSHAIITNQFEYIWRAQSKTGNQVKRYLYGKDKEQLYDLLMDPNQQNNIINDPSYRIIACDFQSKMIEYMKHVACPIDVCAVPDNNMCTETPTINPTNSPIPTVSPIQTCNFIDPCSCYGSTNLGYTCTLDCLVKDGCKTAELYCRSGDNCIVDCMGEVSCGDSQIFANGAIDILVNCMSKDACKASVIQCGSG